MSSEPIKVIGYATLCIAILATLFIFFHEIGSSNAFSIGTLIFGLVQILPYILMGLYFRGKIDSALKGILKYITIILVSILGVYGMIDIVYIHTDAQGAIALFILPFVQIFAFVVLSGVSLIITDFRLK